MAIDIRHELRAKGYRLTPQRQLVLEAVAELDHATPDAICATVQRTAKGVNISTVYRTLELLEELGLVTHTHLGHGASTYHMADAPRHLHLVCRRCGGVAETDAALADQLVARVRAACGFEPDVEHFSVYGTCADCLSAGAG